ncbi:MAG: DUF3617 domain-containing protein [Betaproteobacteria bacterium]|nr:DUF3617 domain-containing protein [Betaproteobacteria bacterium]
MKTAAVLVAAALSAAVAAQAQNPTDAMKGKMKPGMYAYKIEMDMGQVPGLPAGAGKHTSNMKHCVTPQDIEKGQVGKGRDGKSPPNCEVKDFKMSGNTATYRTVCKGEAAMTADTTITFVPEGFNMNMKMAMDQGGQKMNMAQKMEGRYLGPCPAK